MLYSEGCEQAYVRVFCTFELIKTTGPGCISKLILSGIFCNYSLRFEDFRFLRVIMNNSTEGALRSKGNTKKA